LHLGANGRHPCSRLEKQIALVVVLSPSNPCSRPPILK
jgi:hypothetical protein